MLPDAQHTSSRPQAPRCRASQASHGTHDFYKERAALTKELILRNHCHAVALEADFPDAFQVVSRPCANLVAQLRRTGCREYDMENY